MEDFGTPVEEDFHSAVERRTSSESEVFTSSYDGQEAEDNADALGTNDIGEDSCGPSHQPIPFYPNDDDINEWMSSSKLTQSGEEFVIP